MQKASRREIKLRVGKKKQKILLNLLRRLWRSLYRVFLALIIMIYKAYKGSNILGINLGFLFVCYSWPRLFLKKVLSVGRGKHASLIGLPKALPGDKIEIASVYIYFPETAAVFLKLSE